MRIEQNLDGADQFSEARSADVVSASFASTDDPRLRQVLTSLVVKPSLVRQFPWVDDPVQAARAGLPNPFRTVDFAVLLRAAALGADGCEPKAVG
jgi:hypothetical protein